jgi:hypothetical protein
MVLARCLDVQLMMRPLINHSRKSDETINKSFKKEHFIQEKITHQVVRSVHPLILARVHDSKTNTNMMQGPECINDKTMGNCPYNPVQPVMQKHIR